MGAPELPPDTGEENLGPPQQIVVPASDDSDNEMLDDQAHGYRLLASDEAAAAIADNSMMDDTDEEDELANAEVIHGDPNMPHIESIDAEIERQVWNQPRPQELQIEMDSTRTAQILSAMANFTLPNVRVPEWASGVPEERWKEQLLQQIRQRKDVQVGDKNAIEKGASNEQ